MDTLANIQELARALRNMIRTGIIVETDLNAGRCRVQTGGMCAYFHERRSLNNFHRDRVITFEQIAE